MGKARATKTSSTVTATLLMVGLQDAPDNYAVLSRLVLVMHTLSFGIVLKRVRDGQPANRSTIVIYNASGMILSGHAQILKHVCSHRVPFSDIKEMSLTSFRMSSIVRGQALGAHGYAIASTQPRPGVDSGLRFP